MQRSEVAAGKPIPPSRKWLTGPEVGVRYNASRSTLFRWRQDPSFPKPMIPPNGRPRWDVDALDRYFAQRVLPTGCACGS